MIEEIRNERIKKAKGLADAGLDPYPATVSRSAPIGSIINEWSTRKKAKKLTVVGRIFAMRGQGGIIFLDVKDQTGAIQVILTKEKTKKFELIRDNIDIGDFVEVSGAPIVTKRGEKSIDAITARVSAKSLRPIPSEYYGVEDPELRLRQRYLELLLKPELREVFIQKTKFWTAMREFLIQDGFLEVETPVLEHIPGGADAEPFETHYNALDMPVYLRISLEIALKKLLVGGFEKIFEIGRIFRNEGIDAEHLQDYTQMELYWAYQDYDGLMKFIEKLYKYVIKKTTGKLKTTYQGKPINWGKKWNKVDYFTIFKKETGLDLNTATDAELRKYGASQGLDVAKHPGRGRVIDLIFKKIRTKLVDPCFLINPPVDIEPLAKRLEPGSNRVARFQIVAAGTELGKGFSELNDPLDQRERFNEQQKLREQGDVEAQRLDEEFLEAMEYGMPPTAGFGVSERLFAVLMDKPVRETVFFPALRPKK